MNIKILQCIRSKIIDPKKIADMLNVENNTVKEHLNWLLYKQYVTSEGRLTKKGFKKAPEGIIPDGFRIKKAK